MNKIEEIRDLLSSLDDAITEGKRAGLDVSEQEAIRDQTTRQLAALEVELTTLAAEKVAVEAQVWGAHKEAMGTVAEIAMRGDEAFAQGHTLEAEIHGHLAEVTKIMAQRMTRNIIES